MQLIRRKEVSKIQVLQTGQYYMILRRYMTMVNEMQLWWTVSTA